MQPVTLASIFVSCLNVCPFLFLLVHHIVSNDAVEASNELLRAFVVEALHRCAEQAKVENAPQIDLSHFGTHFLLNNQFTFLLLFPIVLRVLFTRSR